MKFPPDEELYEEKVELSEEEPGTSPGSAGQSGDTQGLESMDGYESEDVKELLEEGQAFEASVLAGIVNAPNADEGGVKTRQVREDDVPPEYLEERESER